MANYLEVIFNIPVKAVYTYKNIDPNILDIGYRVEANLGNRKLIGFVTGVTDIEPEGFTVKPILRVV
ncbi:MAG: primosomal protein N', partial [Spirochaetales bacterium]|nr:primosomal protein N' [Spirochaetales bacterium]